MFRRFFGRRIHAPAGLFSGPFFDVRTLFVLEFDRLPSVSAIGDIDGSNASVWLWEQLRGEVIKTWQHSFFDHEDGEVAFARSILQLGGARLVEIGPNYVELFHDGDYAWANGLIRALAAFRNAPKEAPIGFARSGKMN
ncbi:hypothetical protein [Flaviaesturariibacter terrae]